MGDVLACVTFKKQKGTKGHVKNVSTIPFPNHLVLLPQTISATSFLGNSKIFT